MNLIKGGGHPPEKFWYNRYKSGLFRTNLDKKNSASKTVTLLDFWVLEVREW